MTAGLPVSGIGGIFYLLLAFLMPVVEVVQTIRGRSSVRRWRLVLRQSGMACGILAMVFATGKVLSLAFTHVQADSGEVAGKVIHAATVVRLSPVTSMVLSLGTLAMVMLAAQVMQVLARTRAGGQA